MEPTSEPDEPAAGVRIELVPAPKGLWWVLLGGGIGILAPMFGFLVGTAFIDRSAGAPFGAIYLGLFIGVVIGAGGVALAVLGGVRMYRGWLAAQRAAAS